MSEAVSRGIASMAVLLRPVFLPSPCPQLSARGPLPPGDSEEPLWPRCSEKRLDRVDLVPGNASTYSCKAR